MTDPTPTDREPTTSDLDRDPANVPSRLRLMAKMGRFFHGWRGLADELDAMADLIEPALANGVGFVGTLDVERLDVETLIVLAPRFVNWAPGHSRLWAERVAREYAEQRRVRLATPKPGEGEP